MRTTSVPRWSTDMSAVDSVLADGTVRQLVIIADSAVRDEVVRELADRSVPPTCTVRVDEPAGGTELLATTMSKARAGWRFIVIGEEGAVGHLRAHVMRAGALDVEVVVISSEEPDIVATRRRDVFCAHCHSVTVSECAVDGSVACSGCATELTVYHHYSRRHGAYLGYRADSEEMP